MVIVGLGNDLIAITRIQQTYVRFGNRFLKRFLHPHEINEFHRRCATNTLQSNIDAVPLNLTANNHRPFEYLASLWAVKESVYKAFGGEDRKMLNFTNIKLFHSPRGKPGIELEGLTRELAQSLGVTHIHVAITHDHHYAIANVILEKSSG